MQSPAQQPVDAGQLAARLLYLTQQEKIVEQEKKQIKQQCEELFKANELAAKSDTSCQFSDGSIQKIRLGRRATGTYFKVGEDHSEEYKSESAKLQAKYLKAGKAEMADKECTWVAQVIKG
jgi:hypothetical protein